MSSALLQTTLAEIEATIMKIVWRQWGSIGGSVSADRRAKALIDPEALVLVSIMLSHREPRLQDVLYGWLELNAPLLSVQRMRNLGADYVEDVQPRIHKFAEAAKTLAKHPRWSALSDDDDNTSPEITHPDVRRAILAPVDPPANLLLRFRLGLGVGAKADALTVTLGYNGPVTIRQIAETTGYTTVSVRAVLEDLSRAGFVEVVERRPLAFRAGIKRWSNLLGLQQIPQWVPWHPLFSFVVEFMTWAEAAMDRPVGDYVVMVRMQELIRKHANFFDSVPAGGLRSAPPEELAALFVEHLQNWLRWVESVA